MTDTAVMDRLLILYSKLAHRLFPSQELTDDQTLALMQTAALLQVCEKLEGIRQSL